MYTQFFGSFLLNRNVITPEQLIAAIHKEAASQINVQTLALYYNLMTANEIDEIVMEQAKNGGKDFSELAIERKYLTKTHVDQLLAGKSPDYLLLGQVLAEDKIITNSEFESLIADYESENEIDDLELQLSQKEQIEKLIRHYLKLPDTETSVLHEAYLSLIFNNQLHFIGEDFTLLAPIRCEEYAADFCIEQKIIGKYSITSAIDMERSVAIEFASRYATDEFNEFDEYVQASMEDFLNLHNGLFTVNMSNNRNVELQLAPPETHDRDLLEFDPNKLSYLFPVLYSFGTINFLLSF